jgi:DNA-binding CsgD family transcriptional regulator
MKVTRIIHGSVAVYADTVSLTNELCFFIADLFAIMPTIVQRTRFQGRFREAKMSYDESGGGTSNSKCHDDSTASKSGHVNQRPSAMSSTPFKLSVFSEQEQHQLGTRLRLSPREMQLVQAICSEMKDRAIADDLGISVHTVRTYFDRLFKKLNQRSRVGVVSYVFQTLREIHREDDRT